jgi:hypothetical protein
MFAQGNCAEEPNVGPWQLAGATLAQRSPGQCVLVTDVPLLSSTAENLWLHNLLIRHQVSERPNASSPTMVTVDGQDPAALWLTHVTFQGQGMYSEDNEEGCMALYAENPVYMEGDASWLHNCCT